MNSMSRRENEYALYKGDQFLTLGTAKELATYLGVTSNTIKFYMSNTYQKRCSGDNHYVVICLGPKVRW